VVPTFTTNNDRMCLALSDGQVGCLRIEDAERLQVGANRPHNAAVTLVQAEVQLTGPGPPHLHLPVSGQDVITAFCSSFSFDISKMSIDSACTHAWQGLPEGHTEGCWPILGCGLQAHRYFGWHEHEINSCLVLSLCPCY
jgi:hypothetical protein